MALRQCQVGGTLRRVSTHDAEWLGLSGWYVEVAGQPVERKQEPDGGTNVYDPMEQALEEEDADTIVLLSDGRPEHGRYTDPDELRAAVNRLNRTRRAAIHCVSVGRKSRLLRRLAADNEGRYVRK